MPRISKPELIVAVILLSVLLVLLGSTLVLSLFQPVCEEAVHLSGNIKYFPPTRPAFFGLEHGGRSYSVNAPRFLDEQGHQFLDKHRPEKIISIEGIRLYTPLHYKGTLQRLAIKRIEFLEDGKQQTVVVPPELAAPDKERIWTPAARMQAIIATAAMDEASRNAWCREKGIYPQELELWRETATNPHDNGQVAA